ncbi:MAG: isoprenylcysteine carboxylmethyltransferase family protein [Sphingorhabdus sp.]
MKLRILPPLFGLLCALLMIGIAKLLPGLVFRFPGQNFAAAALILSGLSMDIVALVQFRKQQTTISPLSPQKTAAIVKGGVFAISRNPMYLGMLLVLSGFGIYLGSIANLAILAGFVAVITRQQIKPEEEVLREKFGDEYTAYTNAVRRWI